MKEDGAIDGKVLPLDPCRGNRLQMKQFSMWGKSASQTKCCLMIGEARLIQSQHIGLPFMHLSSTQVNVTKRRMFAG